jgi:hypothetical protein
MADSGLPLVSIAANIYPAPLDVVMALWYSARELFVLPPDTGGVMQNAGYELRRTPLLPTVTLSVIGLRSVG